MFIHPLLQHNVSRIIFILSVDSNFFFSACFSIGMLLKILFCLSENVFNFFKIAYLFILALPGLSCWVKAFSSCGEQGVSTL